MDLPINIDLIEDAAHRLDGLAVKTPLLESWQINDALGLRCLFKAECLQRTGSFKFRGAYTKLSRFAEDARKNGVVAYSSGNHAQGVAAAAGLLGAKATIIMPSDAPQIKIDNTRGYGAQIVLYERNSEDRAAIAQRLVEESGSVLVPPFDDIDVISGQGTIGLEIAQQTAQMGIEVDAIFCPVGGGGLLSGLALGLAATLPDAKIWCGEPQGYDDVIRSIVSDKREMADVTVRTICDSIVTPQPGIITIEIIRRLVAGGFAVSDREVKDGMIQLFERMKLVVEPGGSVGFAAARQQSAQFAGKTIVVVLSGGNVDRDLFGRILLQSD
ncbi:MAG: threonine/serine dehydratase [Rhizobiaceae bacterium]|nr:threonine/serine dehydratase [Rhizobiaceae bacterium]